MATAAASEAPTGNRGSSAGAFLVSYGASNEPLGLPGTVRKLSCVDAAGVRQYWTSRDTVTTDAPTTGGVTLPYNAATLTIEGTVP